MVDSASFRMSLAVQQLVCRVREASIRARDARRCSDRSEQAVARTVGIGPELVFRVQDLVQPLAVWFTESLVPQFRRSELLVDDRNRASEEVVLDVVGVWMIDTHQSTDVVELVEIGSLSAQEELFQRLAPERIVGNRP